MSEANYVEFDSVAKTMQCASLIASYSIRGSEPAPPQAAALAAAGEEFR